MKTELKRACALAICVLTLAACAKSPAPSTPVASTTVGTDIDDSVLTTKVKSAMIADEYIKSLDIKVETYKGEVMLSGFATTPEQIERSLKVAQSVEGVKSVKNQLSLQTGHQTVGNKVDDSVITTSVKAALLADNQLKSREIAVVTRKGEVQLSGFVESEQQISLAIELAKAVQGVDQVANHMSVRK